MTINCETTQMFLGRLIDFSDLLGVSRPSSRDIGVWWDNALEEMSEEWIYFLHEINFLGRAIETDQVIKKMREMLEARIRKLEGVPWKM